MSIGKYIVSIMLLAFLLIPTVSMSQVVAPSGKTMEASSQLIFWYDSDTLTTNRESFIQVTNTNDTTPVEIHVQIFVSEDPDGDGPASAVRCREADFNDVLTANDTHVYDLNDVIYLNNGEDNGGAGPTPAPVPNVSGTKGFIVVTPVVGNTDNTAIAFEHLIGTTKVLDVPGSHLYLISAMGRDAVDTATGQSLPDGTELDGINAAFTRIQPNEINFNVASNNADFADIAAIVFADEYNPGGGLLGYRAIPGESTLDPFLFNFQEIPGSCPIATNTCFNNWGLSAEIVNLNVLIDPDVSLCPLVSLQADAQGAFTGWSRIFITLDPAENQLAVVAFTNGNLAGADWANSQ